MSVFDPVVTEAFEEARILLRPNKTALDSEQARHLRVSKIIGT